jgi:hypothetical protein
MLLFEWDPNKAKENLQIQAFLLTKQARPFEIPYRWPFMTPYIPRKKIDLSYWGSHTKIVFW